MLEAKYIKTGAAGNRANDHSVQKHTELKFVRSWISDNQTSNYSTGSIPCFLQTTQERLQS